MSYKTYTSEFKAKVVIEVLQGEKSLSEIASQYNLNPYMVRNWKSEFLENASTIFENPKKAEKAARRKEKAPKKEKETMLKTIGQLTIERDFLQDCFRRSGHPMPELDPNLIRKNANLSVRRQCELLQVNRSSVFTKPRNQRKRIAC